MRCSGKEERLDQEMVTRGITESRSSAQSLILAGSVRVDGERVLKPGKKVLKNSLIEADKGPGWASRGAFKLLKALDVFCVDPFGKVCIDIGASTGGFTDVLLERGAVKVYSVDVGYGQLAWRLRSDERVVVMERTNARDLNPRDLEDTPEVAVMDVSFISVTRILPVIEELLAPGGDCIVLIKPQFEAGKGCVGKKGVVRERSVHLDVLRNVGTYISSMRELVLMGANFSPILGPSGNMEFLFHLRKGGSPPVAMDEGFLRDLVERAHRELLGVPQEETDRTEGVL
ncbi:MAG TPA: TlyA family rRNA (cytidine-2'-O)-methyltransferase [Synergistaceae bacterium]|nr:TlyA family rRNA (cytidine-2'-O)-methyltransferase [Synergistaceae bacterium]